ncbi:MAG: hypothetical protein ACR2N3_13860 [Pyrinomonadaceae bacterium]
MNFCLKDGADLILLPDSQATRQMPFDRIKADLPIVQSNPTIISAGRLPEKLCKYRRVARSLVHDFLRGRNRLGV